MKEDFLFFTHGVWDVCPRPTHISTQPSLIPFSGQPLPPLQNTSTFLCSFPQPSQLLGKKRNEAEEDMTLLLCGQEKRSQGSGQDEL